MRFPDFHDEWQSCKFDDLFKFNVAGDMKQELFNDKYSDDFKYPLFANSIEDEGLLGYYKEYTYEPNSITVTARGVNVGHATVRNTKFNAVGRLIILTAKENLNPHFFSEYINHNVKIYIESTGVPQLTAPSLKINKLHYPSVKEQEKLSNFLVKINEKIELLTKKHRDYQEFKKYLLQNIFSQKLRFDFDDDWINVHIGDVADVVGGGTPSTEIEFYWNGDIDWYTPSEIGKTKFVQHSEKTITEEGLKNSSAKLLPKNTILLSSRATIGETSILTKESTTNQGFQSLIVNNDNDTEFIYYLIETIRNELIRRASGSTFLEISGKEVKKIKIKVPSLEEQEKISSFLSAVDKKISLIQDQISYMEDFKKGLLQQMFEYLTSKNNFPINQILHQSNQ